ncbi:hypothetical protein PHMEG_0007795 [Phytophthora megakarya]|uniref:Uncharacterized protein n=1 Tax=Phytophthora megakarya TaxID=4795 RepID=A0A225WKI7_9STRA|nr:hypothetical protein PHMEG_0007795 [Phytophthora megakarya]
MIYIIEKDLYWLGQSGRKWNKTANLLSFFCSLMPFCARRSTCKKRVFEQLDTNYRLKDQGVLNPYLGVDVEQNANSIKFHQTKYCEGMIERCNAVDAHPSRITMETNMRLTVKDGAVNRRKEAPVNRKNFPYRDLVGSLLYLTICTRADLAFLQHIGAAKRLLRYLVGTKTQGIVYTRNKSVEQKPELIIDGYCASDWGNDPDTRKSTTGFVHCMAGGAVSWASRRQTIVAQSTAEAEYVAVCEACMEVQGLRNMLIQVFPDLETKGEWELAIRRPT